MSLDLYYHPVSAPCRAVMLVAKELNIDLNLIHVDLSKKEQMKPEFLAINPEHTVPTIVDHNNDKFALWESRAIVTYLVDKYSPGHTLYPSDVTTRAQINHWLFFDLGTLFSAFHAAAVPHILMGAPLDEAKVATLKEKLKLVDGALHGKEYLVTDHHTVADLQLLVLITTMESLEIPDLSQFPSITNWVQRLKKEVQGYEEINQAGIDGMKDFIPLLRESLQQQQQ